MKAKHPFSSVIIHEILCKTLHWADWMLKNKYGWYFAICKDKAVEYEACVLWCTYIFQCNKVYFMQYMICILDEKTFTIYGRLNMTRYFYIQIYRSNIRIIIYFCLRLNSWEEIFSNDECLQKTNLKCSQVLRRLQKQ